MTYVCTNMGPGVNQVHQAQCTMSSDNVHGTKPKPSARSPLGSEHLTVLQAQHKTHIFLII